MIDGKSDTVNKTIYLPVSSIDAPPMLPMSMYINYSEQVLVYPPPKPKLIVIPAVNNVNVFSVELPQIYIGSKNTTWQVKQIPDNLATTLYGFIQNSKFPNYSFLPEVVQEDLYGHGFHAGEPSSVKKIYVLAPNNNTMSMFAEPPHNCTALDVPCIPTIQKHIVIRQHPDPIAINELTHIVYIGYPLFCSKQ